MSLVVDGLTTKELSDTMERRHSRCLCFPCNYSAGKKPIITIETVHFFCVVLVNYSCTIFLRRQMTTKTHKKIEHYDVLLIPYCKVNCHLTDTVYLITCEEGDNAKLIFKK